MRTKRQGKIKKKKGMELLKGTNRVWRPTEKKTPRFGSLSSVSARDLLEPAGTREPFLTFQSESLHLGKYTTNFGLI